MPGTEYGHLLALSPGTVHPSSQDGRRPKSRSPQPRSVLLHHADGGIDQQLMPLPPRLLNHCHSLP